MNTQSINKLISKELGLKKSEIVKGYAQICNRQNICYAYSRTYKYVGDFHCKKWYGNIYKIHFDNSVSSDVKDKIVELLNAIGCKDVKGLSSNITFRIVK